MILTKMRLPRCKHFYKIFNENCPIEPTGIKSWKVNYPSLFTNWKAKFVFIFKSSGDIKLRDFSFRLLHKILITKKELLKFRVANDEMCIFCTYSDSIAHTFLDCIMTSSFYSEALMWFNQVNNCNIALTNLQIVFNDIPHFEQLADYQTRRLHLFVILLKQYVYSCKCFEKHPNRQEFQNKVILQWKLKNIEVATYLLNH